MSASGYDELMRYLDQETLEPSDVEVEIFSQLDDNTSALTVSPLSTNVGVEDSFPKSKHNLIIPGSIATNYVWEEDYPSSSHLSIKSTRSNKQTEYESGYKDDSTVGSVVSGAAEVAAQLKSKILSMQKSIEVHNR